MSRFNRSFEIGGKPVGAGHPCFVIAEAGVSHLGSLEKAFALVDMAVEAGADAVKFQIFDVEIMIAKALPDWKARMKTRQLPYEDFSRISDYSAGHGILFMATAHDEPSLDYLETLDVPAYKIGSGEMGNWDFLKRTASLGKPVIMSTGMYAEEDIAAALNVLAETGNRDIAVLHCVTQYPTPPQDVNLKAMVTIRDVFQVVSGYSDHTAGRHFPLAAVAMGAEVLEKHITLEFNIPDAQDWKVSCGPEDLPQMMREIRELACGMGDGRKVPSKGEEKNSAWALKSLVAAQPIPAGTELTAAMLVAKRSGKGISPSLLLQVAGQRAKTDIAEGETISWEQLN